MKTRFSKYLMVFLALAVTNCSDVVGSGVNSDSEGKQFLGITPIYYRDIVPVLTSNMSTHVDSAPIGFSRAFRIPGVLRLDNDWIAVAGDVRWGGTADSPHNIDSVIRVSKDNGKTWEEARFIQYFDDFAHINNYGTSYNSSDVSFSASFIDPGIVQDNNGDLLAISTVFPWASGNMSTATQTRFNSVSPYVVLNGKTYFKLRGSRNYDYTSDTTTTYSMMVPVEGGYVVDRNGDEITDFDNHLVNRSGVTQVSGVTSIYVDDEYIIHTNGVKMTTKQYKTGSSTGNLVHVEPEVIVDVHLFYWDAPVAVVGKNYIFLARSKDNGETWSKPKDIAWQFIPDSPYENYGFYGVSPGVGFRVREGKYEGRILVALQPKVNSTAGCFAATIWSEDNGETWEIGSMAGGANQTALKNDGTIVALQRASETQFIQSEDDQIIGFHRTSTGGDEGTQSSIVAYSVSPDGGETWETFVAPGIASSVGGGTMIGATSMRYSNYFGKRMFAISLPQYEGSMRMCGTVQIGYIDVSDDTFASDPSRKIYKANFPGRNGDGTSDNQLFWDFVTPQSYANVYGYSSVEQMSDGNLIVFYEYFYAGISSSDPVTMLKTLDATIIELDHEN